MPVDAPYTDVIELLCRREVDAEPVFRPAHSDLEVGRRRAARARADPRAPKLEPGAPSEMSPSRNRTLVAGIGGPASWRRTVIGLPAVMATRRSSVRGGAGDACCFVVDAGGVEVLVVGGRSALSS